jgi:RND family efflux transporter MFP subunit
MSAASNALGESPIVDTPPMNVVLPQLGARSTPSRAASDGLGVRRPSDSDRFVSESSGKETGSIQTAASSGASAEHQMLVYLLMSFGDSPNGPTCLAALARHVALAAGGRGTMVAWGVPQGMQRIASSQSGLLTRESPASRTFASAWASIDDKQPMIIGESNPWWCLPIVAHASDGSPGRKCVIALDGRDAWDPLATALRGAAGEVLVRSLSQYQQRRWSLRWSTKKALIVAAAILVASLVGLIPIPYRVRASTRLETVHSRWLAAPFDGRLAKAHVQPGDAVKEGDVLVELDDRQLRMDRDALQAERQQADRRSGSMRAAGKIAEAQLAELERQRLDHRLAVVDDQLKHLQVRSPIDGVVVSGALERAEGAPLELGQQLLEVAPLSRLRVEVEIPEQDIGWVTTTSAVSVRMDSDATYRLEGHLHRVDPSAEVRDGNNIFVGSWEMDNDRDWRPGMRGTATIEGNKTTIAWSWLRPAVERMLQSIGW